LTATFRVWQPVFAALERHHEVIAPTLAGHNGAARNEVGGPLGVASLTDVVERRLDELKLEQVHVAGNSLGGWIALELARRGRARSVTAFSPASSWISVRDLRRVSLIVRAGHLAAVQGGPNVEKILTRPRARQLLLRIAFAHGDRLTPNQMVEMLSDNAGCWGLDEFLRSVWRDGQLAGPLEPPDCPIRIAWPKHDRTLPFRRYGRPALAAVPGAELLMLSGVGHVPMYDDPALVARTILEVTRCGQ
jgi:pimeloyl-ACP methyl ester carboxylesterase